MYFLLARISRYNNHIMVDRKINLNFNIICLLFKIPNNIYRPVKISISDIYGKQLNI